MKIARGKDSPACPVTHSGICLTREELLRDHQCVHYARERWMPKNCILASGSPKVVCSGLYLPVLVGGVAAAAIKTHHTGIYLLLVCAWGRRHPCATGIWSLCTRGSIWCRCAPGAAALTSDMVLLLYSQPRHERVQEIIEQPEVAGAALQPVHHS